MEAHASNASGSAGKWSPSPDASDIVKSIHAMLHPRNIVLVGATDKPGNYAERIWNNLIKYQVRGRPLSGEFEARNHLGRALLQGFRQPAGQAGPRAGAGAGPLRGAGDPRRRRGGRPLRHHRHLGLQRIAGRGKPEAGGRAEAGRQGNRPRRHRPELPRQSQRRRKPVHQHRRPHRHDGGRPGGDRRPIRRDRDGDPPGAGGSRRRRRLHGDDRQRDRPRDARPDELFRRRSLDSRDRGLSRGRA